MDGSRMRSKGSRFTLGVWGLRVCSLDVAFTVATVRNRSQQFATVRAIPVWPCLWEVLQRWSFLEVSDVSLLCFAWQVWHFVTFRRVLQRVESRFAWQQAQYFCDVFRRCVAVFVALYTLHFTLYTLQTPHSSLHTLHSSLYTPHSSLHTFHSSLHTPHSTLCTLHSSLHTLHTTLHTPTLYTLHSILHTLHITLRNSTLYTLYIPHCTLYTPRSTLYTFHSTLQTGNKGNMYKTVQINYCRKVLCVTAYPCVLTSVPLTYV